jgi:hypothetical protein
MARDSKFQHTRPSRRVLLILLAGLSVSLTLGFGSARPAAAPVKLLSGSYPGVIHSGSTVYQVTWILHVSGSSITGSLKATCCPNPRVDPLKGSISGSKVTIVRNCHVASPTDCIQTYVGHIVSDPSSPRTGTLSGTYTHNGTSDPSYTFRMKVRLGRGPPVFEANASKPPEVAVSLDYTGSGWDAAGGSIEILWEGKSVKTLPASEQFTGTYKAERWPRRDKFLAGDTDLRCRGDLAARQGGVTRTLHLSIHAIGFVVFADNDKTVATDDVFCPLEEHTFNGTTGTVITFDPTRAEGISLVVFRHALGEVVLRIHAGRPGGPDPGSYKKQLCTDLYPASRGHVEVFASHERVGGINFKVKPGPGGCPK